MVLVIVFPDTPGEQDSEVAVLTQIEVRQIKKR